jgi:hypothetical protein
LARSPIRSGSGRDTISLWSQDSKICIDATKSIWNEDAINADNTVAVHIRHIREKIEINPKEPRYLKVVWGIGYKVEDIKVE